MDILFYMAACRGVPLSTRSSNAIDNALAISCGTSAIRKGKQRGSLQTQGDLVKEVTLSDAAVMLRTCGCY